MKRLTSLLLAAFMACSMFVISASATYVLSPEYDDIEDEPIPLGPTVPQSPQTGEVFGVAGVAVVAVLCGSVAVVSTKKATERS